MWNGVTQLANGLARTTAAATSPVLGARPGERPGIRRSPCLCGGLESPRLLSQHLLLSSRPKVDVTVVLTSSLAQAGPGSGREVQKVSCHHTVRC